MTGALDPDRLRDAVHAVVGRHPHLAARFCDSSTSRCSHPGRPGGAVAVFELGAGVDSTSRSSGCVPPNVRRCAILPSGRRFRAALIRVGEHRHRFVLTNHHIVLDGWSMPILLREIFASYHGQRLPAAGSYRRFVTWLADRDVMPPTRSGARCWPASTPPHWSAGRIG